MREPGTRLPGTYHQKSICQTHLEINQSGLLEDLPAPKQTKTHNQVMAFNRVVLCETKEIILICTITESDMSGTL